MHTYLFVPGSRPDRFDSAATSGAAVVIIDLEDGVAGCRRDEARAAVAGSLGSWAHAGVEPWVRIDPRNIELDLDAALPDARGIVVAKAETDSIRAVTRRVGQKARDPMAIVATVESATAVRDVADIAAMSGVTQLMLGEVDLAADLGMTVSSHGMEVLPLRLSVVVASAAAGIHPPIGPVWVDLDDSDGLAARAARLADLGFGGMGAVHPDQVAVVNAAFSATPERLERARRIVEAYDRGVEEGAGVVRVEGVGMVDEAVVRHERRLLARGGSSS